MRTLSGVVGIGAAGSSLNQARTSSCKAFSLWRTRTNVSNLPHCRVSEITVECALALVRSWWYATHNEYLVHNMLRSRSWSRTRRESNRQFANSLPSLCTVGNPNGSENKVSCYIRERGYHTHPITIRQPCLEVAKQLTERLPASRPRVDERFTVVCLERAAL